MIAGRGPGSWEQQGEPGRPRRVRQTRRRPWGRLARRWVPETLRDGRIDPGRRGALLLTLVAAVAALVAAVGVWRDRPEPRPVQAVSLSQVSGQSAIGTPTAAGGRTSGALPAVAGAAPPRTSRQGTSVWSAGASGSAAATSAPATSAVGGLIVVSVTGAVHTPGLVRLSTGARVADAIEKAGGTTAHANLTGLNLAAKLTDGASVVISDVAASAGGDSSISGPGSGGQMTAATSTPRVGKLDLNTADVAALDALPGVGPVTAASIVTWRDKNGRFTSVEQLQEITGIGPAKYAALSPLVEVSG
ncbi:ComEA family DNA-binding protein [Nakamurella sp. PAMC28650]|uniref:ComEA family DNA-binding protein n=1 Tax=Nakamurella sp. PAMC28650 TaxID=2762325 RepID=UPI00164DB738|nr:ComEA family DNA-binding protein [Nakamurella sp. PAMC28650]QNK80673.1 ComEA family DNA-binding protein [Nakamurella sp. PAMC28650]